MDVGIVPIVDSISVRGVGFRKRLLTLPGPGKDLIRVPFVYLKRKTSEFVGVCIRVSGKERRIVVAMSMKDPEQVMEHRVGSVLGKKAIVKSDHFPGCQNKRLTPHIDGAPNYRQVLLLKLVIDLN